MSKQELVFSMSAKRNCYDNACAESFSHNFEYIEVDYNRNRRNSDNGYISPEAFEFQQVA